MSCSPTAMGSSWRDIRSTEINDYIKEAIGEEHSAKDFRYLERDHARCGGARRLSARARHEHERGAKPGQAGCRHAGVGISRTHRRSAARPDIDPRVFDRFDGGLTIGGVLDRLPEDPAEWPETQRPIEEAVLDLIDRRESPALERVG